MIAFNKDIKNILYEFHDNDNHKDWEEILILIKNNNYFWVSMYQMQININKF